MSGKQTKADQGLCQALHCHQRAMRFDIACRAHWFQMPEPVREELRAANRLGASKPVDYQSIVKEAISSLTKEYQRAQ